MNEPDSSSRGSAPLVPRGLAWAVVLLLALQLGLGYLQGALLHRQHAELQSMRSDIQDLTDALDQSQGGAGGTVGDGTGWRNSRIRHRDSPRPRYSRTGMAVLDPDEDEKNKEKAVKELQDSRDSAKKAVQDSRKVQEQLSWAENAKKAEQKAKIESTQNEWQKWSLGALALVVLAFLFRGWWRRRG